MENGKLGDHVIASFVVEIVAAYIKYGGGVRATKR
jgi:hypothetical protein